MKPWIHSLGCVLLTLCGATAGWSQTSAPELLVLTEDGQVFFIDTATHTVSTSIALDPDGITATPNTPVCISRTTVRAESTHRAFVVHEDGWITILDVPGRAAVAAVNVRALTGLTGLNLRGCAAAAARDLEVPGGAPTPVRYLHVAADDPSGTFAVILRQAELLSSTTPSPPQVLRLSTSGTGLGAVTLSKPRGEATQRALYSLSRNLSGSSVIETVTLAAGNLRTSPFAEIDRRVIPDNGPRKRLSLSAPRSREAVVHPSGLGVLVNPDTGGSCTIGQPLDGLLLQGPGPNSYSLLAASQSADRLYAVDPQSCAFTSIVTRPGPFALESVNPDCWEGAYLINRGSDSVQFVEPNGTLSSFTINLSSWSSGDCIACPIDAELIKPACTVENITVDVGNFVGDADKDLRVFVDTSECTLQDPLQVKCACFDLDPECPCFCDCDLPEAQQDPLCDCGAYLDFELNQGGALRGGTSPIDSITAPPRIEFVGLNPWKKLGIFFAGPVELDGLGSSDESFVIDIEAVP